MTDSESIVAETAARIFSDLADPQTLNRATDPQAATQLWQALEAAGLTLAWVPEDSGGSGGSIADGFEVLAAAGRAAAPVPLAET
ncbi:MAG: acyl-CoA dehydrogenase family protein, partial [Rhizobiales bacterium]|nr:acyl-CoA dehydrogenase family protein [Hyphomicrobiales bacterium]